jgi:putative zinc finger/helix-turn-helix YgiT family protein
MEVVNSRNTSMFCSECGSKSLSERVAAVEHKIRDRRIRVEQERHLLCANCGELNYTSEMLSESQRAIANVLRADAGLLTTDDLIEVRLSYGFTQEQMEALLGTGPKTWVRWERGKVPHSRQADELLREMGRNPGFVAVLMDRRDIENETARYVIESALAARKERTIDALAQKLEGVDRRTICAVVSASEPQRTPAAALLSVAEAMEHHVGKWPVNVEAIAEDAGLRVFRDPNMGSLSGRIVRDRRGISRAGYNIFVNSREVTYRQRYTIAHEIAHLALHRDLIGDGLAEGMNRSPLGDAREREAEKQAAEILMPTELVRKAFVQENSVFTLAQMFDVSKQAMEIRLSQLGLAYDPA